MKTAILKYIIFASLLLANISLSYAQSAVENNPLEVAEIMLYHEELMKLRGEQAVRMAEINAELSTIAFLKEKELGWQKQYNKYLSNAEGFASSLKASVGIINEIYRIFLNVGKLIHSTKANPEGLAGTVLSIDLYTEIAVSIVSAYNIIDQSVAQGGKANMLNARERCELLWLVEDKIADINNKLRSLIIMVSISDLTTAWAKLSEGCGLNRSSSQIGSLCVHKWSNAGSFAASNLFERPDDELINVNWLSDSVNKWRDKLND